MPQMYFQRSRLIISGFGSQFVTLRSVRMFVLRFLMAFVLLGIVSSICWVKNLSDGHFLKKRESKSVQFLQLFSF